MILAISLLSLLFVTAVSATDNVTNDVASVDDTSNVINLYDDVTEDNDLENYKVSDNQDALGGIESQDEISFDNKEVSALTYQSSSDYGVSISSQIIDYEKSSTSETHVVNARNSNASTYEMKIINHAENNVMSAATLTDISSYNSLNLSSHSASSALSNYLSYNEGRYDVDDYDYDDVDYYDKAVLKPRKISTTYNSGKTFNVKVVSAYDKGYRLDDVRIKLRVYIKGSYKDYYTYTNYYGIAKFKISKLALGTYKVVVSSDDSYTRAKKVTSKFTIKKAKTKVYAPKITTKYKKSKKFKIEVKDKATRKAVKHVKLSVKIGSKKYTLKTNSKGVASFKTKNLGPGTYKVTIKSKNSNYKIKGKSKIIIKAAKKKHKKHHSSSSTSSSGGYYVGSVNSNKFHYPSCGYANRIRSYNLITFSSRSQALSSGYSPCSRCNP